MLVRCVATSSRPVVESTEMRLPRRSSSLKLLFAWRPVSSSLAPSSSISLTARRSSVSSLHSGSLHASSHAPRSPISLALRSRLCMRDFGSTEASRLQPLDLTPQPSRRNVLRLVSASTAARASVPRVPMPWLAESAREVSTPCGSASASPMIPSAESMLPERSSSSRVLPQRRARASAAHAPSPRPVKGIARWRSERLPWRAVPREMAPASRSGLWCNSSERSDGCGPSAAAMVLAPLEVIDEQPSCNTSSPSLDESAVANV
mmetsp:Transcript_70001/g.138796  ORF Transcript_70001/g.138796 Transcript_70001/m.138796 type:complete len:263 (-) Transcript_70001:725-1513(-)